MNCPYCAREMRDAANALELYAQARRDRDEMALAAQALYERVEMDESVGVCLTSRVESLALGDLLSKVLV